MIALLAFAFAYAYRVVWPLLYPFYLIRYVYATQGSARSTGRCQSTTTRAISCAATLLLQLPTGRDNDNQIGHKRKENYGGKTRPARITNEYTENQLPLLLRQRLQGLRAKGGASIAYRRTTDYSGVGCGRSSKRHERDGDDRAKDGRGRGDAAHALGSTTRHARPVAVQASCEHGARL